MAQEEKKSKYQKLEEKLTYSSKNIWSEVDDAEVKKIFDYSESYKDFLAGSKSERLTVKWIREEAEAKGYKNLNESTKINSGGLYYALNIKKEVLKILETCLLLFTSLGNAWSLFLV